MNQQSSAKLIVILLALVASVYFLIPTYNYYTLPEEEREINPTTEVRDLQKKSLNLGLDLQGGMHVVLEVNLLELMRNIADHTESSSGVPVASFKNFFELLAAKTENSQEDFFVLFEETVAETNINLAVFYGDGDRGISNAEIIAKLKEETKDAVDQALAILRNRVDEFGVSEPIIQRQGDRRIIVELAGVKDRKAALSLIGSSALLEFKLVGDDDKIPNFISRIDDRLKKNNFEFSAEVQKATDEAVSSTEGSLTDFSSTQEEATTDDLASESDSASVTDSDSVTAVDEIFDPQARNTLSSLAIHNPGSSELYVDNKDIAKVLEILAQPYVKASLVGYEFLPFKRDSELNPDAPWRLILVRRSAELTGKVVTDAAVSLNNATPIPVVSLEMNGEGAHTWSRVTGNNIGKRIAITLDGKVHSAPVVRGKITGGRSVIEGMGSIEEAKALAIVIKAGALPAPVDIVELRTVGASLGQDTIDKGKTSSVVGLILVILLMLAIYKFSGVVAVVSLLINIILVFAILAGFHATLTLPGIAGLILTIGMAVDANVLIFERIREEMQIGKTLQSAIVSGFENAKSAIYDSNITTFLSGIILYTFGTGPVRGFALTLMVGIICSVFSALVISRYLLEAMTKDKDSFSVGGMNAMIGNTNIDFLSKRKPAIILSVVLVALSLLAVTFKGLNYGIDFKGGTLLEYKFDKAVDIEDVRATLNEIGFGNAEIQTFGDPEDIVVKIDTPKDLEETTNIIKGKLTQTFNQENNPSLESRVETVGPKIGEELKGDAFNSILGALIVILLYMGIRFRSIAFGVAAIVALFHDVLITLGVFDIFSLEIDLPVIAAFLTIVGYSLNDTIIVFDRIREDKEQRKNMSFLELINHSINMNLSRTLMTSITTFLAVLSLFVFGGEIIHNFATALLVGILIGTYSSIYIASPILTLWTKFKDN